jgi:multicomponent Na+:H+ antiporter subunit B
MRKTDILDVAARKLAPFMFLFGLYLVNFGDLSPGGGFQGGAVIASGVILLALARNTNTTEHLFPMWRLQRVESAGYVLFLVAAVAGVVMGGAFLSDIFAGAIDLSRATVRTPFIFMLNLIIGIKVAAGTSLICLALFRDEPGKDSA